MGAPMKGSVKVNFKDCAALMRDLPDKYIKKTVKKATLNQMEKMADVAKNKVPVDSGRLKEMITTKGGYSKKNGVVFATMGLRKIRAKERGKIRLKNLQRSLGYAVKSSGIEYDAYYGVFVEFGTKYQRAQPFARPAFDETHRDVINEYPAECEAGLAYELQKLNNAPTKRIGK
jgi:HK97 gp10 family phage protein